MHLQNFATNHFHSPDTTASTRARQ
jgi:hypothetical protein